MVSVDDGTVKGFGAFSGKACGKWLKRPAEALGVATLFRPEIGAQNLRPSDVFGEGGDVRGENPEYWGLGGGKPANRFFKVENLKSDSKGDTLVGL